MEYNVYGARMPLTVLHTIVIIGTLVLQSIYKLTLTEIVGVIFFVTLYNGVHWFSNNIILKWKTGYFLLQGFIIFIGASIVAESSPIIMLGLMPTFLIQVMYYYQSNFYKVLGYTLIYLFGFSLMIFYTYGENYLWIFIVLFLALMTLAVLILLLYNQKEMENMRMQQYIAELKIANQKIEQLTLQNERQRMARDLHDTLAQKLAGLILELDAVDAHLKRGNMERGQGIVKMAMEHAKEALEESRNVIDNLRDVNSDESFLDRLEEEVHHMEYMMKVPIQIEVSVLPILKVMVEEHILGILSEALNNIRKHAQATEILIHLSVETDVLVMQIRDNGVGIDLKRDLQKTGHYGILGMKERVKLIHGQFEMNGEKGTVITVTIPLK